MTEDDKPSQPACARCGNPADLWHGPWSQRVTLVGAGRAALGRRVPMKARNPR